MPVSSRFQFVAFSDKGTALNTAVREHLTEIETLINAMPPSAESTLSLRKLEESAMWLGKAIARTEGYHR